MDSTDRSEITFFLKKNTAQISIPMSFRHWEKRKINENQFISIANIEYWGRKMSLTSTCSPGWCIITTVKVSPLGKTEPHVRKTVPFSGYSDTNTQALQYLNQEQKNEAESHQSKATTGLCEEQPARVCDQKPLMLRDNNYWQMFNRGIHLSAEDLRSSKPISFTSVYFANWISLWLI